MKLSAFLFALFSLAAFLSGFRTLAGAELLKPRQLAQAQMEMKSIDGMLLKKEGEAYLLLDRAGKEVWIQLDKNTKQLGGTKRAGDMVHAQVDDKGLAVTIQ